MQGKKTKFNCVIIGYYNEIGKLVMHTENDEK